VLTTNIHNNNNNNNNNNKLCGRPPHYALAPVTLTFDLLILKLVSESRVTWATSVPILVFLGLSVLDLGLIDVRDRQTDVRQHHRLMPQPRGRGHNKRIYITPYGRYFRGDFDPTALRSCYSRYDHSTMSINKLIN